MPTRPETISAACRRGTPAATSSATAASARPRLAAAAPPRPRPSDERDLALRRRVEPLRELARRAAHDLLEPLRQLAADGDLPLRIRRRERAQRRRQPLRRLERDGRPRPAAQLVPQRREPLLAARQEAEEAVLLGDEPRGDERRLDRRRPGQHRHVDARVERRAHEPRARIGHARQARVGDERDPLPRLEPRQELRRPLRLVVLVVREEPRLDAVPLEQARACGACPRRGRRRPRRARRARAASRPRGSRSASRRPRAASASAASSASKPTKAAPMRPAAVPSSAFAEPHGAAHRLERLAPRDLLRRPAQVVEGGDAEAAAEHDELRPEDVDEGADAGAEVAADLARAAPSPSRRPRSRAARAGARRPTGRTPRAPPPSQRCPLTYASRWPRPVHAPWQGRPSWTITTWPSSAPAPFRPRKGLPPEMTPPPTPVPSVSMTRSSSPRPAPARHSPIAAAFASLSSPTGMPNRSLHPVAERRVLERHVDGADDDAALLVDRRRGAEADGGDRIVQQLGDRGLELGEDVLLRVVRCRALVPADDAPVAGNDAGKDLRAAEVHSDRMARLHSGYRKPPHGRLRGEAVPRLPRRPDEGEGAARAAAARGARRAVRSDGRGPGRIVERRPRRRLWLGWTRRRWTLVTILGLIVLFAIWGVAGYLSVSSGVSDANARLPKNVPPGADARQRAPHLEPDDDPAARHRPRDRQGQRGPQRRPALRLDHAPPHRSRPAPALLPLDPARPAHERSPATATTRSTPRCS